MDECIDAYLDLSKKVFEVDRVLAGHIPVGDDCCRFDYNILETAIKNIIKGKLGDENCSMNAIPKTVAEVCPTFVVAQTAYDANARPTIFRTYSGAQIRASECGIWEAARATSAAPTFFKPLTIQRPRPAIMYIDGGMGHNNPSEIALEEARKLWPACTKFGLISIGTGQSKANPVLLSNSSQESQKPRFENIKSYVPMLAEWAWNTTQNTKSGVEALIKMAGALSQLATNSEEVHQRVRRQSRFSDTARFPYFRFNVPRDVGDIGLGDWSRSVELGTHTNNYMKKDELEELREQCVAFLLSPLSSRE